MACGSLKDITSSVAKRVPLIMILFWFDFCLTAIQHIFRSFRARLVTLTTLFLGKPPKQFTST